MRESALTLRSEMHADELEFLLQQIRERNLPNAHLEVGTAAGGTLCEMMKCFPNGKAPKFVVVDPMKYFPNQLDTVRNNLQSHGLDPAGVDFRVATSNEAFEEAARKGERFDFMLIDGAHKIRYVNQDLRWTRLLNVGGIACFHDFHQNYKGVLWPVERFLSKHANYRRVALTNTLLVLEKTGESNRPEINSGDVLWANVCSVWLQLERNFRRRLPGK